MLFHRGDPAALDGRRVGIVGTRRCTRYGRDLAHELGRDLAASRRAGGVGAGRRASTGPPTPGPWPPVAAAPPIAVVGSGVDVVYPRRHASCGPTWPPPASCSARRRWARAPEPWRFPVRNRVIAALSEVVVVVESHARGGSRYTVEAAAERSRTVMAVPGSVRSPASAYTNALLADGCPPARDATDVLVALGLSTAGSGRRRPTAAGRPAAGPRARRGRSSSTPSGWEPASLERRRAAQRASPAEVMVALAHLERDGWVASRHGWWERVSAPARGP